MNNNTGLKVSVLMLTYNQERYINEAIRSVMLQETNFLFELVIGNDASTDCTGTICEDWQRKYPEQIVLFNRKKNLGLQQNFIQTYARCRGQYIAICEGDDFWTDKRKLQIQADFLDTHPDYSTCFHRVINYYEDRGTGSAVFVVVDNPVKTGGVVGMRIQKICLDLQFPFVCPEVIALADGDILSPASGVGLYEVLLQSQIFLPVE